MELKEIVREKYGHASVAHWLWGIGAGSVTATVWRYFADQPGVWAVVGGVGVGYLHHLPGE